MTRFLPIAGTHGFHGQPRGDWWQWPSPWLTFMESVGCAPYAKDDPFVWSTSVGGLPFLGAARKHAAWHAAAINLRRYFHGASAATGFPPTDGDAVRIVAHSHGGQVALMAAATTPLRIGTLITVATPVRDDLAPYYAIARHKIGTWVHVYSDWSDRMQVFGQLLDSGLGLRRQMRLADRNVRIAQVGHSGLLQDPAAFARWETEGLLEVLRG